jgi:serine/threonine-protein kinase
MKDVFAVQEEIARAVADELRIALLAIDLPVGAEPSNKNLDAYNAYLKGEFYLSHLTLDNQAKAIENFDVALRFDPSFAEAYAAKAWAWSRVGLYGGLKAADAFEQERAAATSALAIKPQLARAQAALAWVHMTVDWNLAAAETELRRADPSLPNIAHTQAFLRSYQGRANDAVQLELRAIAVDPLYPIYQTWLGAWLFQAGLYDEAERALHKAIELQSESEHNHYLLTAIAVKRGQTEAALQEARQEPAGVLRDAALSLANAASGERAAADKSLDSLIDGHPDSPYLISLVYAFRRDPERAFQWLQSAYNLHDPRLIAMASDVFWQPYRTDARFVELSRKLRLPVTD